MEWMIVITLLAFGLVLVIVEIIFIPGTTFVGLAGFVFLAIGIGSGFRYFGTDVGWALLGGTAVVSGAMLYFSFKANVWGRFALKSSINSRVNEGELDQFQPGQEGIAVSALRPVGKADMGIKTIEVKTLGEYVETGTKIRIIKVLSNQIIVEPIY